MSDIGTIKLENINKIYKIYKKPLYRIIDSIFNQKHYKEYSALKNINLMIEKGEAVGVLGKNGAGKSTLLKIITGVVRQTSGEVNINGRISAILELNSGFDEEISGYENIFTKGLILGFSRSEMDKRVQEIVEFADIGEYINQPVRTYSSGMKSRLGFAIAVSVDPDILIIDEALSVGDDIFKTKCLAKMTEFRKAGKTIFFVSHSLFTIKSFCTKCAWIKDGELIIYGETSKVVSMYETYLKEEKAKTKKINKESSSGEALERKDYIKISKFKFKDKDSSFEYGKDVEYSFVYNVKKQVSGLRWSFTIWDSDEKEIYSSDKMNDDYIVKDTIGEHDLGINLGNIKLLPGKYLLSGEIRDTVGMIYVGYANKKPFYIKESSVSGYGSFYIDHKMTLNK